MKNTLDDLLAPDERRAVDALVEALRRHYPDRIRDVILFGSKARGEGHSDSDIDKLFRKEDALPVPLQRGGVLFLHRRTCHASLPNRSDDIRWSFDLRYNPTGQPTGRGVFPGFVARSRSHPEMELRDPRAWAEIWYAARRALARQSDPTYNR